MRIQTSYVLRVAICVGILLLLFFTAEAAFVGRVVVEVTDSNGKPVAGAVVELWSVVPGPPRSETRVTEKTTPRNGTVEFTLVANGTYLVRVGCPNGDYLPTDDEDHDFTVKSNTIYQRFTCNTGGGGGGGKGNTDRKAGTIPDGSTRIVQTGDWQPGDEVSFSFTGEVVADGDTSDQQADFTGSVVELTDSVGKTTRIPWSEVIRYTVPTATAVWVALRTGDHNVFEKMQIPVYPKGSKLPVQPPAKTLGNSFAFPVHQTGQPYYVFSPNGKFSGDAGQKTLIVTNKAGGPSAQYKALAASPRSAVFAPKIKQAGEYEFKFVHDGRFAETFEVNVVLLKLDTSRAYRTRQKGVLDVIVTLPSSAAAQQRMLADKFHVNIDMGSPEVLAFSSGQTRTVWHLEKGDIKGNQARKAFDVKAGHPGTFKITARSRTPEGSNPSRTGPADRVVISGPGRYFRPDDDPCAKIAQLEREIADKEDEKKNPVGFLSRKKKELEAKRPFGKKGDDALEAEIAALQQQMAELMKGDGVAKRKKELENEIKSLEKQRDELKAECDKKKVPDVAVQPQPPIQPQPPAPAPAPVVRNCPPPQPNAITYWVIFDAASAGMGSNPPNSGNLGARGMQAAEASPGGTTLNKLFSDFIGNPRRRVWIKFVKVSEGYVCVPPDWVLSGAAIEIPSTATPWIELPGPDGIPWSSSNTDTDLALAIRNARNARGLPGRPR